MRVSFICYPAIYLMSIFAIGMEVVRREVERLSAQHSRFPDHGLIQADSSFIIQLPGLTPC